MNELITYTVTYHGTRKCKRKHCSHGIAMVNGHQLFLQKAYYATGKEAFDAIKFRFKHHKIIIE
ncbi:MAG: hypothetical protein ACE1ZQ_00350 [Ignavibacteriaceae bacterium]